METSSRPGKRFVRPSQWFLLTLSVLIPLILLSVSLVSAEPLLVPPTVSGAVVNPDGSAISGVSEVCLNHEHPVTQDIDWWYCDNTGPTGNFAIMLPDPFPFGDYFIIANPPGSSPYFPSVPEGPFYLPGPSPSNTSVGPIRLTEASFDGTVFEPDGFTPVSSPGPVFVFEIGLGGERYDVAEGGYDASGNYAVGGVPPGDWLLDAGPPYGVPLWFSDPVAVHVNPGSQYDPLNTQTIDLDLNAPDLMVDVLNSSGNPITAEVHLWDDYGRSEWRRSPLGVPAVFGDLDLNEFYWIEAWPTPEDIPALANSPVISVEFQGAPLSRTLQLRLPDVSGAVHTPEDNPLPPVTDPNTGDPLPNDVDIKIWNTAGTFEKMVKTNGAGQFSAALPLDDYVLGAKPVAEHLEMLYTKALPEFFTAGGGSAVFPVEPTLTYPSVEGNIFDADGFLIPECTNVWLYDPIADEVVDEHWACGGYYRLGGVPAGIYAIETDGLPYRSLFAPEPILVAILPNTQYDPNSTQTHDIHLVFEQFSAAGELRFPPPPGAPEGPPVPPFEAEALLFDDYGFVDSVPIGLEGRFGFTGLITGSYVVEFELAEHLLIDWKPPQPVTFTLVSPDDAVDLGVIELVPALRTKRVIGRVADEGGNDVHDAFVVAVREDAGGGFVETHTQPNGDYDLWLTGGLWRMFVEPAYPGVDWFFDPHRYPGGEAWVDFPFDPTLELTETVHFTVTRFAPGDRLALTGVITTPDGSPIISETVEANLCRDDGVCFGTWVAPDGFFEILAPGGHYEFDVWVVPETGLIPPHPNFIPILLDEDKDLVAIMGGPLVLRDPLDPSETGEVRGRVVISPTGDGLAGVTIEANLGDHVAHTTTLTDGTFSLRLFPGYWHGGPDLSPNQRERYLVVPPRRREGFVGAGEVISDVNFFVVERDASILGQVVELGTTDVITDAEAVVFAKPCAPDDNCGILAESFVHNGLFALDVLGGYSYTLGIWFPEGGYLPGPPVENVFVAANETLTGTNVSAIKAGTRIFGNLLDATTNQQVTINASVFGSSSDGNFFVEDFVRSDESPHEYNLYVPTPSTNPVTWTIELGVHPRTGYVPDPGRSYTVVIDPGETSQAQNLYVKELDTIISGTVEVGSPTSKVTNTAAPFVIVFAEGVDETDSEGLYFEAETDGNGNYELPVLPGEYLVGAYVPYDLLDTHFPPPLESWASVNDNPINLLFRPQPASGGLNISGNLTVLDSNGDPATLPAGAEISVFGWTDGGGFVEVTGTVASGYSFPVISNTTWYVWAAYEDGNNDIFYESPEAVVNVGTTSESQNLILRQGGVSLPDAICESFDASSFKRISLPAYGSVPEPLLEIQAGTMPVTGTVEVCATPIAALPNGQNVLGFGYNMEARDSSNNLITQDFNKSVRLIFYFDANLLGNVDPTTLIPGFYSTSRQQWVELEDVFIDPDDFFVTGKLDHFTRFAMLVPSGTSSGSTVYLPLIVR